MIEELKMVLDAIGDLSGVALWVVGGFLVYKLIVYLAGTGAVVLLVKLAIEKLHHWATSPRPPKLLSLDGKIKALCITADGTDKRVMEMLRGIRGKGCTIRSEYIHERDADWLEAAIREKEERDATRPEGG